MTRSLADPHAALARVARTPRLLVALDFDGTLAPMPELPMDARMLPVARDAVARLVELPATFVGLVSGRSLHDLRVVAEHADGSRVFLAGSHGAEFWIPGEGLIEPGDPPADVALRDRLRTQAEEIARRYPGAWIEPKTFGFGVHTNRSDEPTSAAAHAQVDALVAAEARHWRRRVGVNIVEYSFRQEGKDAGVAALRERTAATAVFFAGDEVTDEDALRALGAHDLGVHVGPGPTVARLLVPDIAALAALLDELAAERERLLAG